MCVCVVIIGDNMKIKHRKIAHPLNKSVLKGAYPRPLSFS